MFLSGMHSKKSFQLNYNIYFFFYKQKWSQCFRLLFYFPFHHRNCLNVTTMNSMQLIKVIAGLFIIIFHIFLFGRNQLIMISHFQISKNQKNKKKENKSWKNIFKLEDLDPTTPKKKNKKNEVMMTFNLLTNGCQLMSRIITNLAR